MMEDRPEIDLHEVLKNRVETGQPIFIAGNPSAEQKANIDYICSGIAEETGKNVLQIQLVELPSLEKYDIKVSTISGSSMTTTAQTVKVDDIN